MSLSLMSRTWQNISTKLFRLFPFIQIVEINSFDNFKVENAAHLLTFPHKSEQIKIKEVQYSAIDVLSIIRMTLEVFPEGSRHEYWW